MLGMEKPYVSPSARSLAVWMPLDLIDYATEIAEETGTSRNGAIVAILEKDRRNRERRLSKKS